MIINAKFRETWFRKPEYTEEYLEYRKQWKEIPLKGTATDFPIHIDLEINRGCNLACPFCYRPYLPPEERSGFMSFKLFKKIIDEAVKYKTFKSIKLNWLGEPICSPDLIKMVKYAKENGVLEVMMNTNGSILNKRLSRDLINAGIDKIVFSIDSINKENYEKCRVNATWEVTLDNVKSFLKIRGDRTKPLVRVQKVNVPYLSHENEEYIEFCRKIGIDSCAINSYKEKDETKVDTPPSPCPQPFQRILLDYKGYAHPCCSDYKSEYVLGNANEKNIYSMWHSDKMYKLRELCFKGEQGIFPMCRRCEVTK